MNLRDFSTPSFIRVIGLVYLVILGIGTIVEVFQVSGRVPILHTCFKKASYPLTAVRVLMESNLRNFDGKHWSIGSRLDRRVNNLKKCQLSIARSYLKSFSYLDCPISFTAIYKDLISNRTRITKDLL